MSNFTPKCGDTLVTRLGSDTWSIPKYPVAFGASADRQSINQARQAHRMFDLQRRIREAEELVEESASKNKSDIESWEKKWNP